MAIEKYPVDGRKNNGAARDKIDDPRVIISKQPVIIVREPAPRRPTDSESIPVVSSGNDED